MQCQKVQETVEAVCLKGGPTDRANKLMCAAPCAVTKVVNSIATGCNIAYDEEIDVTVSFTFGGEICIHSDDGDAIFKAFSDNHHMDKKTIKSIINDEGVKGIEGTTTGGFKVTFLFAGASVFLTPDRRSSFEQDEGPVSQQLARASGHAAPPVERPHVTKHPYKHPFGK